MSQRNVDIVRQFYAAFSRRDVPSVLTLFHPEIELYQSELVPWGGSYRGRQQVLGFFDKLFSYIQSEVHPDEFIEAGDRVVQVGHSVGRLKSNGRAFKIPAVHVWQLKDGQIVRVEAYLDTPRMRRVLDGQEG